MNSSCFLWNCRNHILPICLPDNDIDLKGRRGIIAGWGKTDLSTGHTGTAILQMASVPIISKTLTRLHRVTHISFECVFETFQVQRNASIGTKRSQYSSNCTRKCFARATRMENKMHVWVRTFDFIHIRLKLIKVFG